MHVFEVGEFTSSFPGPQITVGGTQPLELEEELDEEDDEDDDDDDDELDDEELEAKIQNAAPSLNWVPTLQPIKIIELNVKHSGVPLELHPT